MIPIEVRSKSHSIDGEVAKFVQHRMTFALDRLRHLRRILVFIEDVNGPKGGVDKVCRIVAEFSFASVLAQETQSTWQSAVTRAMHRVSRNAERRLQRLRTTRTHQRTRTSAI